MPTKKSKVTSHLHFTECVVIAICFVSISVCEDRERKSFQFFVVHVFYGVCDFTFLWIGSGALMEQSNGYMKISSIMIFLIFFSACITVVRSPFHQTATKHINLNNLFEFVGCKKMLNARREGRIRIMATQKKNKRFIIIFFCKVIGT